MSTGNSDLWEQSARWWQATFTGGADPEYVEQILPLPEARKAQEISQSGHAHGKIVLEVGA